MTLTAGDVEVMFDVDLELEKPKICEAGQYDETVSCSEPAEFLAYCTKCGYSQFRCAKHAQDLRDKIVRLMREPAYCDHCGTHGRMPDLIRIVPLWDT